MSLLNRKITVSLYKLKQAAILLVISFAISCAPEDLQPDPKLHAQWENPSTIIRFKPDKSFWRRFPRKGTGNDTTLRDSVWGTYEVDAKRINITFTLLGYRERFLTLDTLDTFRLVNTNVAAGVWNYELKKDTILKYQSLTESGTLYFRSR